MTNLHNPPNRGLALKAKIQKTLLTNNFIDLDLNDDDTVVIWNHGTNGFFLDFNGLCVKSAKTLKPIFNKLTKLGFWGFA
jgi:hypothetical protein